MKEERIFNKPVIVAGNDSISYSIAVCFMQAGYPVNLHTAENEKACSAIHAHLADLSLQNPTAVPDAADWSVCDSLESCSESLLAIAVTAEDMAAKKKLVDELELVLSPNAVIAVNIESIGLDQLQQGARHPARIIGLNWTAPAHTTRFLEIIINKLVDQGHVDEIVRVAKQLNKDPYLVDNTGVRSRLLSAMIREAFYLVENGYASVDDVDRACRNDAGYYLPFAGNCRYMDLMGTYAYGMVMKDLNPDLSKELKLPAFFTDIINEGGNGMENGKGFYSYTPEEVKAWRSIFSEFSYQVSEIINKYPFNYQEKDRA